jgi:acetyl-CoA acyltransferase
MPLPRRAFIAGGAITPFIGKGNPNFIAKGHPDFGKRSNPTLKDYINIPVKDLFDSLKIDGSVVDKAYIGNFLGELFNNQGHLGAALAGAHPSLQYKPIMRTEGACASGGLAFAAGMEAIQAGADVVLVSGVEVQNTVNARQGADYLARAADYDRQRKIDEFTFPAIFAARSKANFEAGSITEDDVAAVVVKDYANGNKNPLAHMHAVKMTKEDVGKSPCFLGNKELNPFLRVAQCSQVSDGGAALILVSEAGMKKIGAQRDLCAEILGVGVATSSLYEDTNPLELATTAHAAQRAYAQSGVKPDQLGVVEVHDCFAIAEILMYEALGLAPKGKGATLIRNGDTTLDGRIPCNTGGGLVAYGHPVGATGLKQLIELYKQLKGTAGAYQIKNSPKFAAASNMGGEDRTSVVTVMGQ